MIRVERGQEPEGLEAIRKAEVKRLAAIVRKAPPKATDFGNKYNIARRDLWKSQGRTCCYCERRIDRLYNDVEHFRPKTRAYRGGGRPTHGYWWLAWTWENLLFACPRCNRRHKKNRFPLARGSGILPTGHCPPGPERALLVDPSGTDDPVDHIQFVPLHQAGKGEKWLPVPRGGSRRGKRTIQVLKLDRPALVTDYGDHVADLVSHHVKEIRGAIRAGDGRAVAKAWRTALKRLFHSRQVFQALSHDVLDHHFPLAIRQQWDLTLDRPARAAF
ncbi:HNH endonuclease [Sorangium sp. So ce854]|uniref:HNH endonuclease n=1 Tax=Sorangium sp. So ce854 TaxID=3133322 RepID=UPI003F615EAF